MSDENALQPDVAELFRDLAGVLEDARDRLDALVRSAIPVQQIRSMPAEPTGSN